MSIRPSELFEKSEHRLRRKSFILCFIILLVIVLIIPLIIHGPIADSVLQICFYLLVLFSMNTVKNSRFIKLFAISIAIPLIACDILSIYYESFTLMSAAQILLIFYLSCSIVFILKEVLLATDININLIFGAIMVYLLAGVVWAKLYWLINMFIPDSFKGIDSVDMQNFSFKTALSTQFNLLYYSFTTVSTLGLGDIVPVHSLAKSLTMLQSIFGQLFIAITIAKLVAVWNVRTALSYEFQDKP